MSIFLDLIIRVVDEKKKTHLHIYVNNRKRIKKENEDTADVSERVMAK